MRRPSRFAMTMIGIHLTLSLAGSAFASGTDDCLAPIPFPQDTLFRTFKAFRDRAKPWTDSGLQLVDAAVMFAPRDTSATPPTDFLVRMRFDMSSTIAAWNDELVRGVTSVGCSDRKARITGGGVQANGSYTVTFHVKDIERTCNKGIGVKVFGWDVGSWQQELGTVESDAWNNLQFLISANGTTLAPNFTANATDNVPSWAKELLNIFGNIFAIIPVTNSLMLGFDKKIFEALKTERDFLEGYLQVQLFNQLNTLRQAQIGPTPLNATTVLDLIFKDARFETWQGRTVLSILVSTSPARPVSAFFACQLGTVLADQKHQTEKIGDGIEYTVKRGDSASSIAREFYRQTDYYWLIAASNRIPAGRVGLLRPGTKLRIEPVPDFLYNPDLKIISRGDSLWALAKRRKDSTFRGLVRNNRDLLGDVNHIYPVQIVKLH